MLGLQTRWLPKPTRYDGRQLRPHWIFQQAELLGDALVAFRGEADVRVTEMVDLEDARANRPIYSPEMLHLLGEFFVDHFETGIFLQWNLIHLAYETLALRGYGERLRRRGNDLFFSDRKLSVSIAARSAVSVLVHFGINIRTEGTPIPTAGLDELGVAPEAFAQEILERFAADVASRHRARVKTAPRL